MLKASMRSRRPTIAACLPPENGASEASAISIVSLRQPVSAEAKEIHQRTLGLMPNRRRQIVPPVFTTRWASSR